MKVLIWEGKYADVMVCARDDKEEDRAWLFLFKLMDEDNYYCDLDGDEVAAYEDAKKGIPKSARWLLNIRSDSEYEYERVTVEHPVEP